jgi:hypothetical protein
MLACGRFEPGFIAASTFIHMTRTHSPARRKLIAALGIAAISLTMATVAAGPASAAVARHAIVQPTIVRYYTSANACGVAMEWYFATHHRIYQGCSVIATVNGKPVQWRLMVFPN